PPRLLRILQDGRSSHHPLAARSGSPPSIQASIRGPGEARTRHSFDHFAGASEDRSWDREPECLCSIEIDDEIEQRRLYNREVGRLISVEHPSDIGANLTVYPGEVRAVANQSADINELTPFVHRR